VVFGTPSRLIFGNDVGLASNLRTSGSLRRSRRSPATAASPELSQLHEQGFVVLPAEVPGDAVARIQERYLELIEDPACTATPGTDVPEASRYLVDPLGRLPGLADLLTPHVRDLISTYCDGGFKVLSVRAWRNHALDASWAGRDVYGNLWHNDEGALTGLRFFVPLGDSGPGGLQMHDIAATRRVMRTGFFRRQLICGPARRLAEDPTTITTFTGGLGSACLWNPQLTLHRAGTPAPGTHRDMIQFWIAPARQALSDDWASQMPPDTAVCGDQVLQQVT